MPAHTTQFFLQAGCPSCRPTNSIKALKARIIAIAVTGKSVLVINESQIIG